MKGKLAQLTLGVVLLAALAVGAAGCGSTDISAFTVNGHKVSQSTVDDELKALRDNTQFRAALERQGDVLSTNAYSVTSGVSSGWVNNLIVDELVKIVLARNHGKVTAADRANALKQAPQNFVSQAVFDAFPKFFRDAFVDRGARVFALATALDADLSTQAGTTTVLTALAGVATKAHITVDPRYGTWDRKQLSVLSPLAPGEPRPKPAAAAAPSAGG